MRTDGSVTSPVKREVIGSNPIGPVRRPVAQLEERLQSLSDFVSFYKNNSSEEETNVKI